MVIDLSYSAQVSPDEYAKGGSSAVIDFKNNDVNLYPHVGAGKGYSEGVSFSVGLVNNYEKPEDYGATQKYCIPAPFMVDAKSDYSDAVSYSLASPENGKYVLTVTADSKWINAEERAFPIQIDPSLCRAASNTSATAITNSFIRSADPDNVSNTYAYTYCGKSTAANAYGSVMGALQSYYYISNLPVLPQNSRIVKAELSLYQTGYCGHGELLIRAFELTGTPSTGTSYSNWIKSFTWNNHSTRSTSMLDAVDLTSSTIDEYVNWDITKAVMNWYRDPSSNKGITLEANDVNNLFAYAAFGGYAHSSNRPTLYVHYRNVVGIEPYFTYQTQSAGQAGSGYVADNNLQLTLARTHFSAGSTVNASSITLSYFPHHIVICIEYHAVILPASRRHSSSVLPAER